MRKIVNNQLEIQLNPNLDITKKGKKYEKIDEILDKNPEIYTLVLNDLSSILKNPNTGSEGMSVEQVIRFLLVKQIEGYSYRQLVDEVADSTSLKIFCRIGIRKKIPTFNAVQQNIKKLTPETLKKINDIIVLFAKEIGFEKGRKIRIDSTAVETNIHYPTDNSLIWDCVRVATRLAEYARSELLGEDYYFPNRTRVVKKRHFQIVNTKGKNADKKRNKAYLELLHYGEEVLEETKKLHYAVDIFKTVSVEQYAAQGALSKELIALIIHFEIVLDQTKRRILNNEKVPPSEKIVSIFEPHTDIIEKGSRDTEFGHKVCIAGGASNLILDCIMDLGNPKDTSYYAEAIDRQIDLYGKAPLKLATDGGFASNPNAEYAKSKGIRDVVFTKGVGVDLLDLVKSTYIFKQLRRFRAGIEACISLAKRCYGLDRCNWSGWESFKSYVWSCIIARNLSLLAERASF